MATVSVTPTLLASIGQGFKRQFLAGIARTKTLWQNIAMLVQSSNASEVYPILGRLPSLREWIGNRSVQDLALFDFELKNKKFEGAVRLPRTAVEDDNFGIYGTQAELLGDAANRLPDKLIFSLLEGGFVNLCLDGQAFFSTAHPDNNGGTYSNKGTTALSSASFAVALTQMQQIKDDGGEILGVFDDPTNILLIVGPSNQETGRLILNADFIPNAAGTATESNVWKGAAQLLVVPRLADPNDWYIVDVGKPIKPFIWQSRTAPELVAKTSLTDENVFSRDEYVWGVRMRGNAGYGLPQLAFGAHV